MLYEQSYYRLLAVVIISVAIVAGCASDPTRKADEKPAVAPAESDSLEKPSQATNKKNDLAATAGAPVKNSQAIGSSKLEPGAASTPPPGKAEEPDYSGQYANGKKLSIPKITGSVPPRDDSYHDTGNNAIVVLQSPTEAMKHFPRDRREEVDWVKTLDQGLIEPRANLKGGDEMVTMDLNIIMKNTQFMPWVKFPHLQHTKWLACQNCHPKIFIPQENANPISMNKVLRGEYCGVCHDKVSFSLFICERCHSVPHEGSGPAWWK